MFTIVGLIVAVAAALILLVGVLKVGGSGLESSKVSNAAGELAQLQLGIQSLYSGQASFATLTNTVATQAASVVPSNMNDGGNIVNEWNGNVTILPGTDTSTFTIQEEKVPQDACATLASKAANAQSISIAGAVLTPPAAGQPVDVATITAACTDPTNNTLLFTFGH